MSREHPIFSHTCTGCRRTVTVYQENMAYVLDPEEDICTHAPLWAHVLEYVGPPTVNAELGFCACGPVATVDRLMLAYLHAVDTKDAIVWPESLKDSDTLSLIAYLADKAGWTEHGTHLPWAWPTEDGRAALKNMSTPWQPPRV